VRVPRTLAILPLLALLALAPARGLSRQEPAPTTKPQDEGRQAGQPSDLTIRIVGAARPKVPIAIPPFAAGGDDSRLAEGAKALHDVVRDDLDFSGYFAIVPEDYQKLIHDASLTRINYKEWLGIGAEALLAGRVSLEPSTVVIEGRVYDTSDKKMVLGKRYRGEPDLDRLIAHRLSDEVVLQFTGQQGIAMTRIAYVSQVGKGKEIFVMDYDGARAKRVTGNGSINLSPAWSPDGKEIVFMSYRNGDPELVILNSAGELRKAFPQSGELNSAPSWSPDGRLIAFASSRDGNTEIYTLRAGDGQLHRLTTNDAIDTSPSWSPDGQQIAFTSDRSGAPQIFIMDAQGGDARRLTYDVSYCDAPSWSPLGDRIAFTARVPGGFDIYVKDLKGGQQVQLTQSTNINEWPRWSPDGRHLAFASNRTGNFDIYTMDADGSHVRRLTRGGNSFSPAWSR